MTVEQAYRAINWTTVILVGAMIPLSTAMTKSGAAQHAGGRAGRISSVSCRPVCAAGGAVRADGDPGPADQQHRDGADHHPDRGLAAAKTIGVSAQPVLMSITVASAGAFLTPVATPVNLMVMDPGGYRSATTGSWGCRC